MTTNLLSPSDESAGGGIEKSPSFVEKEFVHDVYDEIADHCFSSPDSSRKNLKWPNVVAFLDSIDEGSLVCDVGCGDGKYMATEAALTGRLSIVSVDLCANLLRTAQLYASKTPSCDVVASNNLLLAFRDGCFDAVVSVGVLHHFSTVERRIQALRELGRLLRPNGGRLLVYVWALEQPKRNFSAQDILVPSDVDFSSSSPSSSSNRSKLRKAISTAAETSEPYWPTKNGHRVIFEEFPNWWNSSNSITWSWTDEGDPKPINDEELNNSVDNNSNKTESKTDLTETSRKNSLTPAGTKADTAPSPSASAPASFFSRMLPQFLRGSRKTSESAVTTTDTAQSVKSDADSVTTKTTTDNGKNLSENDSGASCSPSPKKTGHHATLSNQRSLYRYYHVFCRGELEKLVDALNRECYDARLHHLEFIKMSKDSKDGNKSTHSSTSTDQQEDTGNKTDCENSSAINHRRPPLHRPPSSSLPTFDMLKLNDDDIDIKNTSSNNKENVVEKADNRTVDDQKVTSDQQHSSATASQTQPQPPKKSLKMHLKIVRSYYDHANWAVELERVY